MLGDAFDVSAAFPFRRNGFGHRHGVAFDVPLVVVNDRPPVNDFHPGPPTSGQAVGSEASLDTTRDRTFGQVADRPYGGSSPTTTRGSTSIGLLRRTSACQATTTRDRLANHIATSEHAVVPPLPNL